MGYSARINSYIKQGMSVPKALAAIGGVDGVGHVDLNYPEHFAKDGVDGVRRALADAGLGVNSIAVRFRSEFCAGEFTGPGSRLSAEAYELVCAGVGVAKDLGSDLITLWLGYDGYDYAFQKDFVTATRRLVAVYQQLADQYPDMRFSIEYKPYEERVHTMIPSSGFVLYLLQCIGRPNVGATLDFCHMIMARDYPAHAAALLLADDRLYGIHLNDGYGGSDDGMIVGSVHPWETLELLHWLRRGGYQAPIYFDTFPVREDAAGELRANVAATDALLGLLERQDPDRLQEVADSQDALRVAALRLDLLGGGAGS
ncbi:sugar phosphate isomerase/epimerase [Actinomyces sp.]|uniref:sugar phosphate isomerase/epimerase family protein n=1 Tax=Actinomyces sp. TaxID=29317 RepID=UPI0026DAA363|nr:TIM barrel protein [Actinomyces sp.]MDO4900315.1 TIM barrel protein [Actinomyces sp.]